MSTVTYSAEDDKLRLYVGRVPRDEYERLRAAGFVSTPKQDCDFVAVWSPSREDLAAEYLEDGEDIGDEDYSPEERAADRAERFGDYRDKRRAEAGGAADAFEAGPQAFGHQSRARAERQARRHDRNRTFAVSRWSKAEYWQMRTAGVIRHALYKSSASVRRGRILTLEAELRKIVADYTPTDDPPHIIEQQAYDYAKGEYRHGGAKVPHVWVGPKGRGGRWVELSSLDAIKAGCERWERHIELRLTYERAMLAAEGGSVTEADIEPGGWIRAGRRDVAFGRAAVDADGWAQVLRVFKSPATGRVTSVQVMGRDPYGNDPTLKPRRIDVQRLGEDCYRAPTDEERKQFAETTKTRKAEAKAAAPKAPPLVNPTEAEAERLQAILNAIGKRKHDAKRGTLGEAYKPTEVLRMTQAQYSAASKGSYSHYETRTVHHAGGIIARHKTDMYSSEGAAYDNALAAAVCKVRCRWASGWYNPPHIVVLTDAPQKPLPVDWAALMELAPDAAPVAAGQLF